LISEGLEGGLKNTEIVELDPSIYELVSPAEAARRLGTTEKTIYNRFNSGVLKGRRDEKRTYIWVRKDSVEIPVRSENLDYHFAPTEHKENISEVSTVNHVEIQNLVKELLTLTKTVSERDATITTLNHQLQNAQTALQKRALPMEIDPREKELIELRDQIKQMQAKMNAPWWKRFLG
jgi:hypothetical protein